MIYIFLILNILITITIFKHTKELVYRFDVLLKDMGYVVIHPARKLIFIVDGKRKHMITVRDDSALNFSIEADDKFGNPVVLDAVNAPVFTLSDDSYGAITSDDTGSHFVSNGKLGVVQLQAAIGEIKGILDLNVVAGAAVSLKISASQA